jgi:hypothetical protein
METAMTNILRSIKIHFSAWFFLTLLAIAIFTAIDPTEHGLGTHFRILYLQGAWVWVSIASFFFVGVCGGIGLLIRQKPFHCCSSAYKWTGLFLWITDLPILLWAMQSNRNGLFLAEVGWNLAQVFTISGVMLQIGLNTTYKPRLTYAFKLGNFVAIPSVFRIYLI